MKAKADHTGKKQVSRTRLGLVLGVLLLCLTTACSELGMLKTEPVNTRSGDLSPKATGPIAFELENDQNPSISLVQAIAFALNKAYPVDDIYASLPSACLNDVSLEDFRLYIKALSPGPGLKIKSFNRMDDQVRDGYLKQVLLYSPQLADAAISSEFFVLYYKIADKDDLAGDNYVTLAIQKNPQGHPCLDGSWVRSVNALYTFSNFYFLALEDDAMKAKDYEPLSYILQMSLPYSEELTQHKAEALAQYYEDTVITPPVKSRPLCLLPGYAEYAQAYHYAGSLTGVRHVEFIQQQQNFRVVESIPQQLDAEESELFIYDDALFMGNSYIHAFSSEDLHPLLGQPLEIQRLEQTESDEKAYYRIEYRGLTMVVKGKANIRQRSWKGSIESIELSSSIFKFGAGIHVGMPEADFLWFYPFYADNDHSLSLSGVFSQLKLSYEAQDGQITGILISR